MIRPVGVALAAGGLLLAACGWTPDPMSIGRSPRAEEVRGRVNALSGLPLAFVRNAGQLDGPADYYLHGSAASAYFTPGGLTVSLVNGPRSRWNLRLDLLGADRTAPEPLDRSPTVVSYFRGPPAKWWTGLPTYRGLVYREPWPGVDLRYSGLEGRLKYSFRVEPGADPGDIRMAWRGATGLRVDDRGRLEVRTPGGSLIDEAPVSYQRIDGHRVEVASRYAIRADGSVVFHVGPYDPARPLVIDPTLMVYAGYIGGNSTEHAGDIALDPAGNAYVTGSTASLPATFPKTVGPDLTYGGGLFDAFVAKVNPGGTALVYAGYIGGAGNFDSGSGVAVDGSGAAYVAGSTDSTQANFPVTVGPDLVHNGGLDGFVAKVNPAGTGLEYAGYIGGTANDGAHDIALGPDGAAYVVGDTSSSEASFPVNGGPDTLYGGAQDAFVARVNPSGQDLGYAGYVGGSGEDRGNGVAVDGAGSAYVAGATTSTQATFPVNGGPDVMHNGGNDAFVAKVIPSGAFFSYAGYVGGSNNEIAGGITVDASGAAYLSGITRSSESAGFPVVVGPDVTYNGNTDAFVAKVEPTGTALAYAGYIGGAEDDAGEGGSTEVAVDDAGAAYVTGNTESTEASFPVVGGPDLTHNGGFDAFLAKVLPSGAALATAGYIGGGASDVGSGIAVDSAHSAYLTGTTTSTEATFPDGDGFGGLPGPDQTQNGNLDVWVAKVAEPAPEATCRGKPATLVGTPGNDTLTGTPSRDVVAALGGKDKVRTLGGNDLLCAGGGNDAANGGGGKDKLFGEGGKDKLKGGGDDDKLNGGKSQDQCAGGSGTDKAAKCETERGVP